MCRSWKWRPAATCRNRTRSCGTSPAARRSRPTIASTAPRLGSRLCCSKNIQRSLEPNLGAAWFWLTLVKGGRDLQVHALEDWMEQGYRALTVMENHVRTYPFFAADHYTVADIALYAYTHIAHEVGFDLTGFPAVRAWLKRVAEQPGHVAMDWQPARMAIAG